MSAIDVLTIVTDDLDRSQAFYRLLGVGPSDATSPSFAVLGLDHSRVAWTTEPLGSPPSCGHLRLGVRCSDALELERIHRAAVAAGHRVVSAPHDAAWGATVCTLLDPDGNAVELYVPLP